MLEIRLTNSGGNTLSGFDYWYVTATEFGFAMSERSYQRMMVKMGLHPEDPHHLIEIAEWVRDNLFPNAKIVA